MQRGWHPPGGEVEALGTASHAYSLVLTPLLRSTGTTELFKPDFVSACPTSIDWSEISKNYHDLTRGHQEEVR